MSKKRGKKGKKSKKAEERLRAKKDMQKKLFFAVVGAVIVVILIVGVVMLNLAGGDDEPEYLDSKLDSNNENVIISVSDVDDGAFHYYNYDAGGTAINYFVVQGDNGEIHTAFDACDQCFSAKKGYSRDGDEAKCNNCGLTYPIEDLGTKNVAGGCWPGMLPHTLTDGSIYIKTADLTGGEHYFE